MKSRTDAPESNLGDSLRALRQRNRWSLATVAEKTGLATSTISRIENNQLSLTYEKLLQLCRGLEIDIPTLFAGGDALPGQPPGGFARRTFTPPGEGREVQAAHYYYRYLCTELANKKMTPIFGEISARSLEEVGGYMLRHDGEEVVYVLEGTLELHTEHYEPLRVEAGGCVYFDSGMGHAFVSVGKGPARILSVCSTPERVIAAAEEARRAAQSSLPGKRTAAKHPAVSKTTRKR